MNRDPSQFQDDKTTQAIHDLISAHGGDPATFSGEMVSQLIETCLKLFRDGHDTGQLKLLNRAMKDMRYAYRVFNRYKGTRKIAIFGSARTPEDHPDYIAARHLWMSITGAGDGIMKAGHEGPQREGSFGLSIRLPFETTANTVIEGDPKLINFRYFFTRKLMFMSHADAVAVFPGGFGTHDEIFEALTLVQTGKSNMVPVVLAEGEGGRYWSNFNEYLRENLLAGKMISPEDPDLYRVAGTVDEAVEHVLRFYRVYHSSRYVHRTLVMRLLRPLTDEQVAQLNDEFGMLIETGRIEQCEALQGESDHLELPRLAFHHNRRHYAHLRGLIDRINSFADTAAPADRKAERV
ncbi:MAG: LOG family protein [Planctomycetota bacterium]|jgi:uncharacterized protein (TIGR00730 family)